MRFAALQRPELRWCTAGTGNRKNSETVRKYYAREFAHDAATRMAACTTQVQAVDRRVVLRGKWHGAQHEELVHGQFGMVPVPAMDAEFPLDVFRRQQFGGHHFGADVRRVLRQRIHHHLGEGRFAAIPVLVQVARRVLHHG